MNRFRSDRSATTRGARVRGIAIVVARCLVHEAAQPTARVGDACNNRRSPGRHGGGRQAGFSVSAKRIGLWIFLAVVTSLFCLFISAYYMRMGGHAGHDSLAPGDWQAIRDPSILWFNTVLLIFGSIAMQSARSAVARKVSVQQTRVRLFAAGLLTFAFLDRPVVRLARDSLFGAVLAAESLRSLSSMCSQPCMDCICWADCSYGRAPWRARCVKTWS